MKLRTSIAPFCIVALTMFYIDPITGLAHRGQSRPAPSDAQRQQPGATVSTIDKSKPKFALLVGISEYANKEITKLDGCVNDAMLMQDVLMKNFGFTSKQIVTLLNEKATKEAILATFGSHLVKNAEMNKGQDPIVVFYFAGHGSQARDQDGDEADGWDETLVPYDSRTEGKYDIIDDEIDDLLAGLSSHTSNVTFIFDSCHSGTASRGDEPLIAREAPRDTRPQPKRGLTTSKRSDVNIRDSESNAMLQRSDNKSYVLLSGCMASQRSYERRTKKGEKPHGALTYNLVQHLRRASSKTSYRELMQDVSVAVTKESPNQSPQVEGKIDRAILGGEATREDPFIEITNVDRQTVTIAAGEAHGIKVGTVIAIYAQDAQELVGEEGKLTTAVVTDVEPISSKAKMPEAKDNPKVRQVSLKAKAVLLAPNFGGAPLQVATVPAGASRGAGPSAPVQAEVAKILREPGRQLIESKMIELVEAAPSAATRSKEPPAWDLAVMRGRFNEVFADRQKVAPPAKDAQGKEIPLPENNPEIYYIDDGGGEALFGLFVKVNDPGGAQKLADAIEKFAKQRNLRALANNASPLNDGIKISVLRVEGEWDKDAQGKDAFKPKGQSEVPVPEGQTSYEFDQGVYFRLKIENQTGKELFVTAINNSTDGSIKVMYPTQGAREPLADGRSVITPIYRTTGPAGQESFKIIATTSYTDFSFLEQSGVTRGRGDDSPLTQILSQSGVKTRDEQVREFKVDEWGTKQIDFVIRKKEAAANK